MWIPCATLSYLYFLKVYDRVVCISIVNDDKLTDMCFLGFQTVKFVSIEMCEIRANCELTLKKEDQFNENIRIECDCEFSFFFLFFCVLFEKYSEEIF